MNASDLRAWAKAKRGRSAELARALGVSRAFVAQMVLAQRPIPDTMAPLIAHEIARSKRLEKTAEPAAA